MSSIEQTNTDNHTVKNNTVYYLIAFILVIALAIYIVLERSYVSCKEFPIKPKNAGKKKKKNKKSSSITDKPKAE